MPPIPYNPDIPKPADQPSQSQSLLLENFQGIEDWVDVDHVLFSDPDDAGKHNKVSLIEQGADPAAVANQIAVYSKAVSGTTQLFLRRENGDVIDWTSRSVNRTVLPSGLVLQWGATATAMSGGNSVATVVFPTAFSSSLYNIQLTVRGTAGFSDAQRIAIRTESTSLSQFTVETWQTSNNTSRNANFYWYAIGV